MRAEELAFYMTHEVFPDGTPEPEDIVKVTKELFGARFIKNYRHLRKRGRRQGSVLRAGPEAEGVYQMADDPAL
jgi:hypothetical protein